MARIPYPDLKKASAETQEMIGRLPAPINVFNMLAHADTLVKPVMKLGGAILAKTKLDPKLRELALLHAVKLEGGDYEWVQHVPVALNLGATQAQIDALERGEETAPCFSPSEVAALRLTREVVVNVRAAPETLAAARAHHSDREIVELIVMAGFYIMLARLTETTGVENEASIADKMLADINAWKNKPKIAPSRKS
jgi:alkylhydroperoxidase family enzyme